MSEEWKKEFIEQLYEELQKYTDQNLLMSPEDEDRWKVRSILPILPNKEVLFQTDVFKLYPGRVHAEVFVILTTEAKEENYAELAKAIEGLNYFSPAGTFGLLRNHHMVYLRYVVIMDEKQEREKMIENIIAVYNIMIQALTGGYGGLEAIWSGMVTYDEAVQKGYLKKYTD